MRPASIATFERLFLASLALSAIGFAVGYETLTEQLAREPALQQLGLGSEILIGSFAIGMAIYLLLWFLIARKASNLAKWILVVLSVIGALFFIPALAGSWDLTMLLNLAYYALEIGAVAYLFRDDAVAWLKGERNAGPAAFD